jgi:ABC-type multidrug transport system ATPase subunit
MFGLKVQNLTKHYQDGHGLVKAVDDVSFEVPFGSIMALLGPNGSGKTTSLDCVVGLTEPDAGEIFTIDQTGQHYRPFVGCISSKSEYYWMFTGNQLLANYRKLLGVAPARVQELIEHFDLSHRLNRKWHQYSSGEQMRLRIIIALLNDPKVLVLDEPTVGLDPIVAELLRDELRRCRELGKAIILTSHHMNDIEELADTVYFLKQGKVIRHGSLSSFKQPKKLIAVEYYQPIENSPWQLTNAANTYSIPFEELSNALALAPVKSIHSIEEGLEDYFKSLALGDN